jgi:hypothetical protein
VNDVFSVELFDLSCACELVSRAHTEIYETGPINFHTLEYMRMLTRTHRRLVDRFQEIRILADLECQMVDFYSHNGRPHRETNY